MKTANMKTVNLDQLNLDCANLGNANLDQTNLNNINLNNVNLDNVNNNSIDSSNINSSINNSNNTIDFNNGTPVTLEEVLQAKEQRVIRQQMTISRYNSPIISLTLVTPGAVKRSPITDYLFRQSILEIKNALAIRQIPILSQQYIYLVTGQEAIMAINHPALQLKQLCMQLEVDHPLGRLWDIDVIDPLTHSAISRSQFVAPPRGCLVCGDNAKVCGRERRHTIDELFAAMTKIIEHYHATLN
ncbi:citrate lyase holo-[acyl-carrier protein] synthase [Orbaceae bacterium ESL0721]|nr:citrate lyase holo-[acyl-carrier protein] synthase [Orbaceae bacterium ESL0721]